MAVANVDGWKYKPGQVIVSASPLVYSLSKESTDYFCAGCFKSTVLPDDVVDEKPLRQCGNCHQFKYCGHECQLSDWKKFHKLGECKIYAKHGTKITSNFTRFALRVVLLQEKKSQILTKKVKLIDENERSFQDLKDHFEDVKNDENRVKFFMSTFKLFTSFGLNFDAESLFRTFSKLCINSFSILDISLNEIGTGLYIETSIFDHSCKPNAAPVFNGLQIEIRSLQNIPFGEPVTINYVDIKEPRSSRQSKLKAQYYFTCQCARCSKEESEGEATSIWNEIAKLDKKYDDLVNSGNNDGSNVPWNECYMLLIQTLPLYETIYGPYHPDFTVQLMRCLKVRSNIDFVDGSDGLTFLSSKLLQGIEVTHGKEHPLYKEFKECFNCD